MLKTPSRHRNYVIFSLTDNCDIAENISVCLRHYNVTSTPTKRPQTRTTSLHQSTTTETDSTSSAPQTTGLQR